jgi:acetyl esterase/lipase
MSSLICTLLLLLPTALMAYEPSNQLARETFPLPSGLRGGVIPGWPEAVQVVQIRSSADGSLQPSLFYCPAKDKPVPLLVALHTWSSDYRQPDPGYARWCTAKGWALMHPNFRGPNNSPDAMGSEYVVQDILDAVAYATNHAAIDPERIYLMGGSGGGYASLLMAGRAPEVWAGVSAWVPIFDLSDWHRECTRAQRNYAQMMENACGGAPGSSPEVDRQYRERSASTYLAKALKVPLDINTGIHDGHTGSVPVSHALRAFNLLAMPENQLSATDIVYITSKRAIPISLSSEHLDDPLYRDKPVRFRRTSGNARITIFEGGHEIIVEAGLQWLAQQRRSQPAHWAVPLVAKPIFSPRATEVGK